MTRSSWSGDKLQLEPGLAESWKAIDPTTWEFKWPKASNSTTAPITAEDVKFSIERIPTLKGPNPTTIYVRQVKETKARTIFTLTTTSGPAPTLPNDFIKFFHRQPQGGGGPDAENVNEVGMGKAAVGTGPFKFVKWTPKEEFILERNPDYWQGPSPGARRAQGSPNDAARVAQAAEIVRAPAADVPVLERDDHRCEGRNRSTSSTSSLICATRPSRSAPRTARPCRRIRSRTSACGRRSISASTARRSPSIAMEGLGTPQSQLVTPNIFGYAKDIAAAK